MQKRPAFSLVELMVAVFIFSFVAASMSTIYSTAHRHMLQNYRADVVKTGLLVGIRAIQGKLPAATRIDSPAPNARGNVLDFATNIDGVTGCYPINQAAAAASPPAWHHFCLADDPVHAGTQALYYHTATLGGGTSCDSASPSIWGGSYPVPPGSCGASLSGQTVTKLTQFAVVPAGGALFSRRSNEGIYDKASVRVFLRVQWDPAVRGMAASQRKVDVTLDTVLTASSYCP